MIWHFFRYLVTFTLPFFYKKVRGKNLGVLREKGPIIISMNHPNAFTESIAFAVLAFPPKFYYLARGDAFRGKIASWFFGQMGIVPIFRMQDGGKEGLKKNEDSYVRVNHLLRKNKKVVIYSEGLCIQERRLRPLKKGVARMVFGAEKFLKDGNLKIIPIGVNYSKRPHKLRGNIFYNVGEPLYAKDFVEQFDDNEAKGYNVFLQALEPRMKELIVHVNNPLYDETVEQIEILCKKMYAKELGLNLKNPESEFEISIKICEKVNSAELNKPNILADFKLKSDAYFEQLKKSGLRDWLIDPLQNAGLRPFNLFLRCFLLLLGTPIHLMGLIGNYLPYKLTEKLTKRILKGNLEFYSSIVLGLGIVIFCLNYVIWFYGIYLFTPNILVPLCICLAFVVCGYFSIDFQFYILKTLGMTRAVKNKALVNKLSETRKELISLINKF